MFTSRKVLSFLRKRPILADISAWLGMFYFLWQVWQMAHRQFSVLDEGLYLYKGWLFASGQYTPFQNNGLWTNQMPLAFLIPGWVQAWFSNGLETGRLFAVATAALSVLGWWLAARRLSNPWMAGVMTWAIALNPAAIRMISVAASQGLTSCLLAWTLFFGLGEKRKNWELFLAGALAGTVVMVRINLIPLLPLLALYILWQHPDLRQLAGRRPRDRQREWRAVGWLLAGMLLTFGSVHLAYLPNILRLWAKWLPLPFLQPWFPPPMQPTWDPDNPLGFRVSSFFLAYRYHFAAMFGLWATWVLWPRQEFQERKAALFLFIFLFFATALHAWAALGNEYCVFCFPTYTTFYSHAALLLFVIIAPSLAWNPSLVRNWFGSLGVLALAGGMAYSAEGTVEDLLGQGFYKRLLSTTVPNWGGAQIWQIAANKFEMEMEQVFDLTRTWFPVASAVLLALLLLSVPILLLGRRKNAGLGASLVFILALGTLFSASPLLAGEYTAYDCPEDVLPGYKRAGQELAALVPPGSQIYWAGYSPTILLYLPEIKIYPPQLHGVYSLRVSDDADALLRYGWWNQALAQEWLYSADYVLVESRNLGRKNWLNDELNNFKLLGKTHPQSCDADSALWVYRRK